MADDFTPRLRGNTFFMFLLRAARDDLGVAPSWGSSSEGLTQPQMFANLMRTVDATYTVNNEESLRQYISQYMKGTRTNSPTYYPFQSSSFRNGADFRYKTEYEDALSEMDSLCRRYLKFDNKAAMHLLVGGIVSLILKDGSIPIETTFNTGYTEVTRADLARETDFILQPFLLSVWHFIVVHFPEAKEGVETYMRWTADAGGGNPRTITTVWGSKRADKIHVATVLPAVEENTDNTGIEEADEPEETEETIQVEPEIVEIQDYSTPFFDPISQRQIMAQFHVENHGSGAAVGINYGGIHIGGKKKNE